MDFKSLVGQESVIRILTRTADRDQLPNSYLFTGPEGVGKWAAALALTAYLNCRKSSGGDSCGTCPACRQIHNLQFPNLYIAIPTPPSKSEKEELANYWEILNRKIAEPYALAGGEREMSIPVDTVRDMKRNLAQKAPQAGRRVVIVDQMDRMRTQSADALLKLIEEPPSQTLIIITSARPERLLPTVISRCRPVRFGAIAENEIVSYLQVRAGLTGHPAVLAARLSQGSLGQALYLASGDSEQDRETAKLIFNGLFLADPVTLAAEAIDLLPVKDRFRLIRILGVWRTLFRDLILLKNGGDKAELVNIDYDDQLIRLAGRDLPEASLLEIPAYLNTVIGDIELNVEPRTAVGAALFELRRRLGAV